MDAGLGSSVAFSIKHQGSIRMTDELIELLRRRVSSHHYDRPEVIEVIARAILHSRGIYPQ
jgi:hypothetical protein